MTAVPLLPAVGKAVNPSGVHISPGLEHLYDFNWLYCFLLSFSLYFVLSKLFPAKETIIPEMILGIAEEASDSITDEKSNGTEIKAMDV